MGIPSPVVHGQDTKLWDSEEIRVLNSSIIDRIKFKPVLPRIVLGRNAGADPAAD